jgi:hypothetical protein
LPPCSWVPSLYLRYWTDLPQKFGGSNYVRRIIKKTLLYSDYLLKVLQGSSSGGSWSRGCRNRRGAVSVHVVDSMVSEM